MHTRETWIKNSKFHELTSAEVLAEVIARVEKVKVAGKLPVVVFDLDSTLLDVSRRSYEILREWLAHPEHHSFSETIQSLKSVQPHHMRYSLEDVWEQHQISYQDEPYASQLKHAKEFWRKRFFGHDYLKHDEPTEGALQFVKKLHEMGTKIVYLTGRDVPLMYFGTVDQLKQHALPIEVDRTRLILKPKRHLDDITFKSGAAATIMAFGEVVASFENEPKNLVAMAKVYKPETMNIFIETVSSDHPAPVGVGLYKIKNFCL